MFPEETTVSSKPRTITPYGDSLLTRYRGSLLNVVWYCFGSSDAYWRGADDDLVRVHRLLDSMLDWGAS